MVTKKNDCNAIKSESRVEYIKEVMAEFGIPGNKYIDFYTPCQILKFFEKDFSPSQYSDLSKLLNSCAPVKMKSIVDKQKRIKDRAFVIQ